MASRYEAARISRFIVRLAGAAVVAGLLTANTAPATAAPDAAIVVDAKTGGTLYSSAADAQRYPASLTKMMTLYLLFEAIEDGRTSLNARVRFSAHAAGQPPSKLGIGVGQTISVRDAILALVTTSANDVAAAVAEHIAGTESNFAVRMTQKARALGMSATTFKNASGLPNSAQVTTARDVATLGRALREHYPQYYSYFSTPAFVWNGTSMRNHNNLLGRINGVDGIKTGYTRASGYNLITSVQRGGRQIVAVVIGSETSSWRDHPMAELIEKYLPKASLGARTAALIPGGPGSGGITRLVALDEYPLPRLRPVDAGIAVASVAAIVTATASFVPVTAEGDAAVDDEGPARDLAPTGWKIQIAAAPTRSSAESLLDKALAEAGAVLADASPYTEPVTAGNGTLYRARFAGFADKEAARAACAYLVERDFACLALTD